MFKKYGYFGEEQDLIEEEISQHNDTPIVNTQR